MRRKNKLKNNKGVTLVEVLVATALLAVATTPILSALVTSARIEAKSRIRQETTSITQDVMEELKAESLETSFAALQTATEAYEFGGLTVQPTDISDVTISTADGVIMNTGYHAVISNVKDSYTIEITATLDDSYGDGGNGYEAFSSSGSKLAQNFRYRITVSLYRDGSDEAFSELTGTKLERKIISY